VATGTLWRHLQRPAGSVEERRSGLRLILLPFLVALVLLADLAPLGVAAQQGDLVPAETHPSTSPEQQLVERYAPIVYLKRQRFTCDTSGEPYVPMPVEAVLGDPQVLLRLDSGADDASLDPIVKTSPSMEDIAFLGDGYYLDFPGNPLEPHCSYEQWARRKLDELEPTVYARIASVENEDVLPGQESRLDGLEGLVIQYWFFYVYNDFNNKHEGDWEMVQLNFAASTIEGALRTEPISITLAQHGGGERASWDSAKVRKEGYRPVVFPSAGSHATQFGREVYIGWGENGTGFGCDDSSPPSRRIEPNVVLMPSEPQADGQFDWLLFYGRWGEKQPWEFNGPQGPQRGRKWNRPVTWVQEARERSLYLPNTPGLGPMPGDVFCGLSDMLSDALVFFTLRPWLFAGATLGVFGSVVYLLTIARRQITRAARIYWVYRGSFTSVGLLLFPMGILVTLLQRALLATPPLRWVVDLVGQSDEARLAVTLLIGGLLAILEAILVGPAVIALIQMINRGEPTDAWRAYGRAWRRRADLFEGWLWVDIGILLRAVTIIGLPFAIRDAVRWIFFGQAIMIDNARTWRGARAVSAAAVHGTWWRTAGKALLFSVIGIIPGPVIGMILLLTLGPSIAFVNVLSSLIYAIVIPYKYIGLTMLYLDRTERTEQVMAKVGRDEAVQIEERARARERSGTQDQVYGMGDG